MRVGAIAGDDGRIGDHRVVEIGVHVERHGDRGFGVDRAQPLQEFSLAILQALGDHRTVQIEHDAVKSAARRRLADRLGNVFIGGVLDRAARRGTGGDRQHDLGPLALGEIEISTEPGAGAAIGADRRLAIKRPRPNRASGVGTGEKVLVSCFIIAINRRITVPPVLWRLWRFWIPAANIAICIAVSQTELDVTSYSVAEAKNTLPKLIDRCCRARRSSLHGTASRSPS